MDIPLGNGARTETDGLDLAASYRLSRWQDTAGVFTFYAAANLLFNYKYSPKLAFGIGAGGGYNWVDIGPNETFEQGLLRVQYQLTGKISLNATAGVEVRQFDSSDNSGSRGNRVSGVYEIGAVYQPFDGTVITLRGSSRVLNSAIVADSDFLATNILLGVRQHPLRQIHAEQAARKRCDHWPAQSGSTPCIEHVEATRLFDAGILQHRCDERWRAIRQSFQLRFEAGGKTVEGCLDKAIRCAIGHVSPGARRQHVARNRILRLFFEPFF